MDYVKSSAAKEQLLLAASMAKENKDANCSNFPSTIVVSFPLWGTPEQTHLGSQTIARPIK